MARDMQRERDKNDKADDSAADDNGEIAVMQI